MPSSRLERPEEDEKQTDPKAVDIVQSTTAKLADDCLRQTFSFLDITDLPAAARVCKTWNSMMPEAHGSLYHECIKSPFIRRIMKEEKESGPLPMNITETLSEIRKRALDFVNTNRFFIGIDPVQTDLDLGPLITKGESIDSSREMDIDDLWEDEIRNIDDEQFYTTHLSNYLLPPSSYEKSLEMLETALQFPPFREPMLDYITQMSHLFTTERYSGYTGISIPQVLQFWDGANPDQKWAIIRVTLRNRDLETFQKILQKEPEFIRFYSTVTIREAAYVAVSCHMPDDSDIVDTPSFFKEVISLLEKNGISTIQMIQNCMPLLYTGAMSPRKATALFSLLYPYIHEHFEASRLSTGQALPPPIPPQG
jgi:hypothetical protein